MAISLDHISVTVSDLERSTRFYCAGLGFEQDREMIFTNLPIAPDEAGHAVFAEAPRAGYRTRSRWLHGHGITLVLNLIEIPRDPLGQPGGRFGLSNWAFRVDDLDATAQTLRTLGGRVPDTGPIVLDMGEHHWHVLVCADPDGEMVELIEWRAKT